MGVADGAHVHAQQLELGGHVRAGEGRGLAAGQLVGDGARHAVARRHQAEHAAVPGGAYADGVDRSEEHTSELQSREKHVCRLLLEKKKTIYYPPTTISISL